MIHYQAATKSFFQREIFHASTMSKSANDGKLAAPYGHRALCGMRIVRLSDAKFVKSSDRACGRCVGVLSKVSRTHPVFGGVDEVLD